MSKKDTFNEELIDFVKQAHGATGIVLILFDDQGLISSHVQVPPELALYSAGILSDIAEIIDTNNSKDKG